MLVELDNEREIVRRCQEGDLGALEEVYRCLQQPLLRYALRVLGGREEAEDAVQQTFVRLHRAIGGFRGESRLSTYVMRIAINVCRDDLRARARHVPAAAVEEPSYHPSTDLRLQLEEAIGRLPDRMRECFVLFAVEGLAQKEIADMLAVSVGTVKAQVFQARERLRSLLADPPEEMAP